MRVTNTMITNNSKYHMQNAKRSMLKYNDQYTTQKKIQRPSDDPIIASRAMKFRAQIKELEQYLERNVPDAKSWMEATDSELEIVSEILTQIKQTCDQGANDPLTASDRKDLVDALKQNVQSIFTESANKDFNGRYLFTGYRTDTSLVFGDDVNRDNLFYNITENFKTSQIEQFNIVTDGARYDAAIFDGQDYVDMAAEMKSVFRIVLGYNNLSNSGMTINADGTVTQPDGTPANYVEFSYTYKDNAGLEQTVTKTATTKSSNDPGAYEVGDDDIVFLYDTGEVLIGKNVNSELVAKQASISIGYTKTEFGRDDIRPEHYYKCDSFNKVTERVINYKDPRGQDIEYDINFSQSLHVNMQACDAFSTDIHRAIDYIAQAVDAVNDIENKMAEVDRLIERETDPDKLAALNSLKTTLQQEFEMRTKVMQEAFGKGLTMVKNTQQQLSNSIADLDARYVRLEMTYNKLLDDMDNLESMKSENENIDLGEAYTNLYQADLLYQASLSATAKILGNTLLDYI